MQTFKTNVVFGSVPIGNMMDISINMIYHIRDADIILMEHQDQFDFFINKLQKVCKEINFDLEIKAEKFLYNLESQAGLIDKINAEIIELSQTKKILVFSDEGSSLFLEPTNALKHQLILEDMQFTVMSGPNSVISSITNVLPNIREFLFLGTFDYIEQTEQKLIESFNMAKTYGGASVILLNGPHIYKCLDSIKKIFDSNIYLDFAINLSTNSETHIRGGIDRVYQIIDNNKDLFKNDRYQNRFSLTIMPNNFRYELHPKNSYKIEENSLEFKFDWNNIHDE